MPKQLKDYHVVNNYIFMPKCTQIHKNKTEFELISFKIKQNFNYKAF